MWSSWWGFLERYPSIDTIDTFAKVSILYRYLFSSILPITNTCEQNSLRTTHEWFANQTRIFVDGNLNLCYTVCKWFAYHSPQTEICRFSAQTQRELGALSVLCLPKILGKLIYHMPSTNCSRTIWFAGVYWPLESHSLSTSNCVVFSTSYTTSIYLCIEGG